MRKSTHEVNQRPYELHEDGAPEFVRLPSEFSENSAPEIVPLPDEFNRNAPIIEPERRKASTLQKIMLYLASIGLVILGVITPIVRINDPEPIEEATPAAAAEQIAQATAGPTSKASFAPTAASSVTPICC